MDEGGAPAAVLGVVEREGSNRRMPGEDGVDSAPEVADAFAVNDADLEDPFCLAGRQVIRHEVFDLTRKEGVQIQHTIDRQVNRLFHLCEEVTRRSTACQQGKALRRDRRPP